jgi:hypothetical protein
MMLPILTCIKYVYACVYLYVRACKGLHPRLGKTMRHYLLPGTHEPHVGGNNACGLLDGIRGGGGITDGKRRGL